MKAVHASQHEHDARADRFTRAASRLALDAATVEVVRALRREQLRAILIKGPAIALRLYGDSAERHYDDIDLLVEQRSVRAAERILHSLGFRELSAGVRDSERAPHATTWQRSVPPRAAVDLHTSIYWYDGRPSALWAELGQGTARIELGGESIEVLGAPAQALVLAAHALQHGASRKPLEDLERALTRIDATAWREAAAIAERLNLVAAFAAGLSRTRLGAQLVDEWRLQPSPSVEMRLRAAGAHPLAIAFARLAAAPPRARLAFIAGRLMPSPASMRLAHPLARRGRAGLALAYLNRLFGLGRQAPAALRSLASPAGSRLRRGPS